MNRSLFLLIAVLLAIVAALVPLVVSVRFAEQEANRREQEHLQAFMHGALQRIERVMADATRASFPILGTLLMRI
jgi:sensor c-di-GMP phosphodiesterase-like protein